FMSMMPGVSWAGHLGGGVAGAAVSVPLVWSLYGRGGQRWLGWAGTAAVPLLALAVLYQAIAPARQDVEESDPELNRARQEYAPLLRRIDAIATNTYEDHAAQFLKGAEVPKAGTDSLIKAQEAFARARVRLRAEAASLAAVGP